MKKNMKKSGPVGVLVLSNHNRNDLIFFHLSIKSMIKLHHKLDFQPNLRLFDSRVQHRRCFFFVRKYLKVEIRLEASSTSFCLLACFFLVLSIYSLKFIYSQLFLIAESGQFKWHLITNRSFICIYSPLLLLECCNDLEILRYDSTKIVQ